MHDDMIIPKTYSAENLKKGEEMRARIKVPKEIDSPFFFARFLTANNGDVEKTTEKIYELFEHRKLLGYENATDLEIFTKVEIGRQTFERFNISLIDYGRTSNNVHVFVQKMEGTDLKEIMKVIPLSYVLHSYYMLQENFSRAMAHTERETGKPSSVVCILDLKGLNLTDFLNPLSGPAQLARLVVDVWARHFSEHLCKLLLINPPGIISLMWQVTRRIIDTNTAEKLAFLSSTDDLKKYLEVNVIPEEYGGTYRDDSGYAEPPESVCRPPKQIKKADHKNPDLFWTEYGLLKAPKSKSFSVKSHQSMKYFSKSQGAGKLVWSFTSSGDIEFEILKKESGKESNVWPKITLTSLKLPETGNIEISSGEYSLVLHNPSNTWFPVKINCSFEMFPM
ncbi:unnamed protein product [Caenorhabditis bovis]|uniref:CRAL-TRIO domain-containing protein n=1 Tax=Caenorhabditis bovis TaxID=2654633 RepID=A0A8S1EE49_9PELO|nr:unnamed protein product [Caenorhabditis bovis]